MFERVIGKFYKRIYIYVLDNLPKCTGREMKNYIEYNLSHAESNDPENLNFHR